MQLSPLVYDSFIRPQWFTNKYIHKYIKKHCKLDNKIVLDFGSGTGSNCILSSPEFYTGLDPDKKRIDFAKRKYPDYEFNVLMDKKIPVRDHSVDIILVIAVLHHIPVHKIELYLKEFQRILKKESSEIIILEPCLLNKKSIKNWLMKRLDKGDFIQDEQTYLNYFENAGFETKTIHRFPKCFIYNEILFKARKV